jgi:hypothetical protein
MIASQSHHSIHPKPTPPLAATTANPAPLTTTTTAATTTITHNPGGFSFNNGKLVHDPGGNSVNTKDGALRDDGDGNSDSDVFHAAADNNHSRNKTVSTIINVRSICESVHVDCPVSDATPSRSSTKLPAILHLDAKRTNAAWCPLSAQHLADSVNFDRSRRRPHPTGPAPQQQ